jgi:hypothetical protein
MDNDAVLEIIFGRWRSQIAYSGVKLGVFDALGREGKDAPLIAKELGLDPVLSYRLLRAIGSLGLLPRPTKPMGVVIVAWACPWLTTCSRLGTPSTSGIARQPRPRACWPKGPYGPPRPGASGAAFSHGRYVMLGFYSELADLYGS